MRRYLHIVVAAFLAAMCVIPTAGQNYRASKVKEKAEPEPLSFSRSITSRKTINTNLRESTSGWEIKECDLDNGTYWNTFDDNYIRYDCVFYGLSAEKENYDLWIQMKLFYKGPNEVELTAYSFTLFGNRHPVMQLTSGDDYFNRSWLWRVMHDKETVELQRKTAEECFNFVADSLEDFLRNGPRSESQLLD